LRLEGKIKFTAALELTICEEINGQQFNKGNKTRFYFSNQSTTIPFKMRRKRM
jgi:hypothetical protein